MSRDQRPRWAPGRRRRWSARIARPLVLLLAVLAAPSVTGCMERWFFQPTPGATPPPRDVPGAESVWFTSADGTPLHGWFLPAQGPGADRHHAPTVLHVHGNAGNIASHRWFTEHLPPAGINVFIFDYRGYGESHGSATRRGPLIEDTNAALDCLLRRANVDPRRIGFYGQSLGGSIALPVMARRSEIRAAVLESPFCSWRDMAAGALGGEPPNLVSRMLAWLFIRDSHRPLDAVARIDRPMLLLHGDADTIIPVTHSRRLLQAAGGNVRLIELPGGEHNSLRDSHPRIDRIMIDFFREHLSPVDETAADDLSPRSGP